MIHACPSHDAHTPWNLPLFCRISACMPLRTSSRQLAVRAIEWLPSTLTAGFSDRMTSSSLPRMREATFCSKRAVRISPR